MEKLVGTVDDYFAHVGVIALKLEGDLSVGDEIHVKGHASDFTQKVDSMQIEHVQVTKAKPGDSVGIKVSDHAHKKDKVFKLIP